MDVGNLVVDLASLVIIASVFTITVVRTTSPSSDEQTLLSDDPPTRGYYGPNPSETEEAAHEA